MCIRDRQSDELLRRIASTGYEELKSQLKSLNELLEQLGKSEARWKQTATALKRWEEEDITSNQTLWDMEEFENRTIDLETLERLKKNMVSMRTDTEKQHQETAAAVRELKKQEKQTRDELEKLRSGSKAYPKYLENARSYIQRRLLEKTGKSVDVHVLADLLDVKRDEWRNAVEGYLGNNKLNLVVAPKYARSARSDRLRPDSFRPDGTRSVRLRPDNFRPDSPRSDSFRSDRLRPNNFRPDSAQSVSPQSSGTRYDREFRHNRYRFCPCSSRYSRLHCRAGTAGPV